MERPTLERLIDRVGPERIVAELTAYLTEPRRRRIEGVLARRVRSVHVAIEAPSDPHNAAAVVRTCEGLGAWAVHVVAAEGDVLHKQRTTQGAYRWVETRHHRTLDDFVADARARGLRIAGACMDAAIELAEVPVDHALCLLFGNETSGLSSGAREACDLLFGIPMHGMSESLNLSVSAAISLHEVLRRRRVLLGRPGDLEPAELAHERARYYAKSVDDRLVRGLFGDA